MATALSGIPLNPALAFRLALKSLLRRKMIALATLVGVAIGIGVVNAVLIVDANTPRSQAQSEAAERALDGATDPALKPPGIVAGEQRVGLSNFTISIERRRDRQAPSSLVPTQRGAT